VVCFGVLARSATLVVFALSVLAGCSADSVSEPEPALERGGSFVAVTSTEGAIILLRTLRIVRLDGPESIYEAIVYEGQPSSYAEAKAWAQDRDWPVYDSHGIFSLQDVLSSDPEVVWFRTLTASEYAALLH
jgi:hypothetical protein